MQEPVLDLIQFLLSMADLLRLLESQCLHPWWWQSDEIYGLCKSNDSAKLQCPLLGCISDVAFRLRSSLLPLNSTKTELLWFSSVCRQQQHQSDETPKAPIFIGSVNITPVPFRPESRYLVMMYRCGHTL